MLRPDCPGTRLNENLRREGIVCEYADREYLVMMPSVDTTGQELDRLICVLGDCPLPRSGAQTADGAFSCRLPAAQTAMRVREAIFAPAETVSVEDAEGRICAGSDRQLSACYPHRRFRRNNHPRPYPPVCALRHPACVGRAQPIKHPPYRP